MITDHYAEAGLRYLPIDRVKEFPECLDGRPVLMLDCGHPAIGHYYDGGHRGVWINSNLGVEAYPTHFLPASLEPIGEHVAVEYGAFVTSSHEYSIAGHSAHSARDWLGSRTLAATGVIRIPVRRPPHGEAL